MDSFISGKQEAVKSICIEMLDNYKGK